VSSEDKDTPAAAPSMADGLPPVLTVDEVAAFLRLNRKTVYEAIHRGEIPARRIGNALRIGRDQVIDWLRQGRVPRTSRRKR